MKNYLLIVLVSCLALGTGCSQPENASEETSDQRVYTVRGMVRDVPNPDQPGSEFSVHHEAIDDFVSVQGDVVGMSSMTMPFPLAKGVDLEGITIGDPVTLTLVIDWDGDPPVQVTSVQELPQGTTLDFRKAEPPVSTDP